MSTNAQEGCGRGENKYVKEIHFLHSFPGLFPNCPQFAREKESGTRHITTYNIHTQKKKTIIYLLYNRFILIYLFLHHTITTASTEKKNLLTMVHTPMQSLTFSQAKFFTYAKVHCKPTNVHSLMSAVQF